MEAGSRKLEVGSWKLEVGSRNSEDPLWLSYFKVNGFFLSMGELDMTEVFMKKWQRQKQTETHAYNNNVTV